MTKKEVFFRRLEHFSSRTGARMICDYGKPHMMVCHSMGLKKYTKALLYGIQNRSTGRRIVKP